MNQEEFNTKLKQAAVLHNIALIQKRTGLPDNYRSSIESYRKSLELYTECHDFYNLLCASGGNERREINGYRGDTRAYPTIESPSSYTTSTPMAAVNLELKIAQTLQSIAKLHIKLNEDSMAIKSHEDAITILLEGKNQQQQTCVQMDEDDDFRQNMNVDNGTAINTNTPASKNHRSGSSSKTPPSVTADIFHTNINHTSQYNITQLTNHERTRIISMSLASLAQIYFNREVRSKSCNEEYDLSHEEDALQYYQESLNFLKAVTMDNPVSTTNIPALSNEKIPLIAGNTMHGSEDQHSFSSDANQTPSLSTTYAIDLRKDISSILLSMATLYQKRSLFSKVVESYEQARDLRLLLNCSPRDQEMVESLLAIAYERNGQWGEALGCYQHVLKVRKGLFGGASVEVGNLYVSMGNLHRKTGDLGQSLGWNKRAVAIYQQLCDNGNVKGKDVDGNGTKNFHTHRHLIGSLQNQGALYVQMKEVHRAIASYLTVIEKQATFRGGDHPDVASTLNILGDLYMSIHEFSEARASFSRALALYQKYGSGNEDPDMASTLQSLCEIEVMMGGDQRKNTTKRSLKDYPPRQPNPKSQPKSFKPPSRPSVAEQLLEENVYCKVVETNPSFDDDDDAVSQLTFLTHQPEPVVERRDAQTIASISAKSYQTFEQRIEDWSPAELVFRAVEKVAIATEEFFIGPPTTNHTAKKNRTRKISPEGSVKKTLQNRRNGFQPKSDLECVQGGYEVRQFESIIDSQMIARETKRFDNNHHQTIPPSLSKSQSHDHEATSSILEVQQSSTEDDLEDESVGTGTEVTSVFGSLAGTKFLNEADSIAAGTQTSTLFGTDFIECLGTDVEEDEHLRIRNQRPSSTSDTRIEVEEDALKNASCDIPLIDEMLAQMNVVTCDMEGDAKPFEEILKGENIYGKKQSRSLMKQDKAFEKLSACLDTLIELKDKYGPDHGKVIQTMSKLAALYLESGNAKGIAKYNEVLELQIKKYGEFSAQVSATHVNLGEYWAKKRDIDNAIDSFSKSKEIDTYLYGNNHPQIAQHLNRMGLAELERSEFDIAMDYLQEALRKQKMHLGPNEINPDVSLTMVNMGSVYYKERNSLQKIRSNKDSYKNFIEAGMLGKIAFAHSERGEYIMAMNFYGEELELLENRGDPSYAIAAIHTSLGKLNVKAGRYTEAMEHHTQALKAMEQSSDNNKLDICNANCDIGVVEFHLGNFKIASTILENACSVQREILGNEHSRVARTMYHLAVIKRNQFKIERATQLLNQALRIQMSTLGQYNPDTIDTQMEIAKVHLDSDLFDEALKEFENVFNTQKEMLGTDYPDRAWTLHFIGIRYSKMGDNERSMMYFERCYRMQTQFFKFDSPAVASTMDQIEQALLKQGKLEKAFRAFQDAERIYREVGEDHYGVAFSLYNMGRFYSAKCKYVDSLRCFKESMRIAVRTFGLDHPFIADIHVGVGNLNTRKCDFDEAKSEFKLALQIYNKCKVPEMHSKVKTCKRDLARVEHEEALCV